MKNGPARNRRFAALALAMAAAAASISGCQTTQPRKQAPAPVKVPSPTTDARLDQAREAAYARTLCEFEKAVFLKPPNVDNPPEEVTLAPILVFETDDATEESSVGHVSRRVARVAWTRRGIELSGQPREQIAYYWRHETSSRDSGLLGIRLTLDEFGMPALAEVLVNATPRKIFVSERLESLAREAHGPPLPGRRYSIEPPVDAYPNIVVARVLADGPIPMGPLVYVGVEGSTITTLLCRCMPSQAAEFVETAYYDLVPMGYVEASVTVAENGHELPPDAEKWLEHRLRLPPKW